MEIIEFTETVAFNLNQEAESLLEKGELEEAYAACMKALETVPYYALACKIFPKVLQ
ncbi:MAG: hypothetical protein F6K35_51410, partial [Okeania sp. SIO2H7]|nr:hypothetical protein [Okeania sp. SIO2H7]